MTTVKKHDACMHTFYELDFIMKALCVQDAMSVFHVSVFVLQVSESFAAQVTPEVFFPLVLGIAVVAKRLEGVEHLKAQYAQVLFMKLACMQAQLFLRH